MTSPCPGYEWSRDQADVLLQGRVILQPFPGVRLLKVERYFKGEGRQYVLIAEGSNRGYEKERREQGILIGLEDRPTGLTAERCGYLQLPGHGSIAALEPGIPPRPGADLGLAAFWVYITVSVVLLVLIYGVYRFLFPRQVPRDAP